MDESTSSKRRKLDPGTTAQGDETEGLVDEPPRFFLDEDDDNNNDIEERPDQNPRSVSSSKPNSRSNPKIVHTGHDPHADGNAVMHICPICARTLETDNQGLNTHIDWCLSKNMIKEAQTTAAVKSGKRRR